MVAAAVNPQDRFAAQMKSRKPITREPMPLAFQSALLFGAYSTGKTSIAAKFKNHVYYDLEGSASNQVDVTHLPIERTWEDWRDWVNWVYGGGDLAGAETVIVDTANDLFQMCREYTLKRLGLLVEPEEDFGRTTRAIRDEFSGPFNQLMLLSAARRLGVVFIAHESKKQEDLPGGIAKITVPIPLVADKNIAELISGKCNMVFRTFKTTINPANGEVWPEERYLLYTDKDRTTDGTTLGLLPKLMGASYEVLEREYNKAVQAATTKTKGAAS